jgi:hypothetical protein
MGFHNGVPIAVVSQLQSMLTPTESTSRRRAAEEGERFEQSDESKVAQRRIRHRPG